MTDVTFTRAASLDDVVEILGEPYEEWLKAGVAFELHEPLEPRQLQVLVEAIESSKAYALSLTDHKALTDQDAAKVAEAVGNNKRGGMKYIGLGSLGGCGACGDSTLKAFTATLKKRQDLAYIDLTNHCWSDALVRALVLAARGCQDLVELRLVDSVEHQFSLETYQAMASLRLSNCKLTGLGRGAEGAKLEASVSAFCIANPTCDENISQLHRKLLASPVECDVSSELGVLAEAESNRLLTLVAPLVCSYEAMGFFKFVETLELSVGSSAGEKRDEHETVASLDQNQRLKYLQARASCIEENLQGLLLKVARALNGAKEPKDVLLQFDIFDAEVSEEIVRIRSADTPARGKKKKNIPGESRINGKYARAGEHHGQPYFTRNLEGETSTPAVLYFYDDRDGLEYQGWYVSAELASDEVWAMVSGDTTFPSSTSKWQKGWKGSPINVEVEKLETKCYKLSHATFASQQPGAPCRCAAHFAPPENHAQRVERARQLGGKGKGGGRGRGAGNQIALEPSRATLALDSPIALALAYHMVLGEVRRQGGQTAYCVNGFDWKEYKQPPSVILGIQWLDGLSSEVQLTFCNLVRVQHFLKRYGEMLVVHQDMEPEDLPAFPTCAELAITPIERSVMQETARVFQEFSLSVLTADNIRFILQDLGLRPADAELLLKRTGADKAPIHVDEFLDLLN